MAEILSSNSNYNIDIYTSNAVDFKALRDSTGKIVEKSDKYFNTVNKLKINRIPINYKSTIEEQINKIKSIEEYKSLKLSDETLKELLKNGPNIIEILKSLNSNYDLIHSKQAFSSSNLLMAASLLLKVLIFLWPHRTK